MNDGSTGSMTESLAQSGESLLRSGLKLSHMRMIVALQDTSQISAAAHILNISQPAASRMIGEMEDILSAPICNRLPRGVELTPYGTTLARRARAMLLELREVDREISDLKSGRGGAVFLGSVTAPAIGLAVPAIKRIRKSFPSIEISMQVDTSAVLARELLASRHDFIIARIPDDLNPRLFEARVIGIEKACLIVRRGHPLADGRTVGLEELTGYDWIFQPGGSLLRRTMETHFMSHHVPLPDRILNTTSLLLTLVMVAQSDTIAPVALDVAKFINADDGLAGAIEVLPIAFDIDVQPYSLIRARNRALSPAASLLYDHILQEIR
ncbi:MAG: LysR family transcriptional regulator [Alphaproteobacteria bacterium]|jgi:DNA-binding transcriptional LysR family regulator|nr:LysR family transcriptional regulator [Alphaproteobacteria bacterium]MBU0802825.1 LysR family transcriptional regulator [Alphaproteobacteria bacterium]MBU0871622.1 LysR family transcriptional regulator [Alphaproteobacteria bacterium]MBU1400289.1 LysR family transcriptional regulator [Alphaproteobacteria bacterium]MBU1591409.1 LysR family transcriptional regulator [Alphaproteobacteria bacterium]